MNMSRKDRIIAAKLEQHALEIARADLHKAAEMHTAAASELSRLQAAMLEITDEKQVLPAWKRLRAGREAVTAAAATLGAARLAFDRARAPDEARRQAAVAPAFKPL